MRKQVPTALDPGLTVGVVKNGQLIYHHSEGLMNLDHEVPFNDSSVFSLASVTKQFTAACIALLEKKDNYLSMMMFENTFLNCLSPQIL